MATIVLNFGLAPIVVIAGTAVGVPEYPLDSLTEGHGGRFTGVIVNRRRPHRCRPLPNWEWAQRGCTKHEARGDGIVNGVCML